MSRTNKCNGCSECIQGGFGNLVKKAANATLIFGTVGISKGVSMIANANERNCVHCGHRLEFHEQDSHGQYVR